MPGPIDYRAMVGGLLGVTPVAQRFPQNKQGLLSNDLTEGAARPYAGGGIGYHGSPTLGPGMKVDLNRSATTPRTDSGYFGKAFYLTPQRWLAEAYAKPPKGGQPGHVTQTELPRGRYLDVKYNENYVANLEAAAKSLGVKDKFMSSGWAENFAKAARKAGYVGARGLNNDGTAAEIAIFDPSKLKLK